MSPLSWLVLVLGMVFGSLIVCAVAGAVAASATVQGVGSDVTTTDERAHSPQYSTNPPPAISAIEKMNRRLPRQSPVTRCVVPWPPFEGVRVDLGENDT
ncbi:hypothetical protein [Haloplanus halophilus]|uniref:hypothetical protein n=1 Tax=Haloplanus halophilus TaxID=2949993 RepID=UPI00203F54C0|nr:hypothetical protein [Haloplanus sp. GDY1]